eukprot:CAMPEP_0174729698 /NCGR_PEP_ID=MMETSP1094-20130205/54185_1 /TAXON_ID=156173 /ORGANISM="Chrysochromulina brevifilum, Strain UTEX LB 985" /LENGTH=105 /DNA_ID=CAMNT_0015931847 /DNA_START=1 /DNA_END=314 /DNA_ORIENTATION=+
MLRPTPADVDEPRALREPELLSLSLLVAAALAAALSVLPPLRWLFGGPTISTLSADRLLGLGSSIVSGGVWDVGAVRPTAAWKRPPARAAPVALPPPRLLPPLPP